MMVKSCVIRRIDARTGQRANIGAIHRRRGYVLQPVRKKTKTVGKFNVSALYIIVVLQDGLELR